MVRFLLIFGLAVALWGQIPSMGLIGHWRIEEGTGTMISDTTGQNPGTLQGSATWTAGRLPNTFALDFQGGYIKVPNSATLATPSALTVGVWYFHTSAATDRGYLIGKTTSGYNWQLHLGYQQLEWDVVTGGTRQQVRFPPTSVVGGLDAYNNTWVLAVGVYDGSRVHIYVNGVEKNSLAALGTISGGGDLGIAARGGDGSNVRFAGKIDEAFLYNRALSVAEIQAIWSGSAPPPPPPPPSSPVITVNTGVSFQTMDSFGSGSYIGDNLDPSPAAAAFRATVFDKAAADGIHWVTSGYVPCDETWSVLDARFDQRILPRLQRSGNLGWWNATFVDFSTAPCVTGFNHALSPAEYGDMVLAFYQHYKSRNGVVPTSWEIILEPDNIGQSWLGTRIGQSAVDAGAKLAAAGFTPRFVVPSTTSMANAAPWWDAIAAVPGALQYVSHLSYHRYFGASQANLQALVSRAQAAGKKLGMVEYNAATYLDLHEDLTVGKNTTWIQGPLSAEPATWSSCVSGQIYEQVNGVVTDCPKTKHYRQYWKWVAPGAVRIDAASNNTAIEPVAFQNPGSGVTVVSKVGVPGSVTINGLPTDTYGLRLVDGSGAATDFADASIAAGGSLMTNIPSAGVFTVYSRKPLLPPTPPSAPLNLNATGQFSLSWLPVIGATSYTVKRATTAGGPYTVLASGLIATTFIDATPVNDTAYWYIITAVNSSGESLPSRQLSAIYGVIP